MNGQQENETKLNEQLRFFFSRRLAERATPEYFEEMLGQVHRRLHQDLVQQPSWWERLGDLLAPFSPGLRPLLVRFALPAILLTAGAGFLLQHDRAGEQALARSQAVEASSAASLADASPALLAKVKEESRRSLVAPARGSGVREEMATKAKDPENGGRSFVSVLPVRYEASVDF